MEKQQAQIKDFVILPRKIRDDYLKGKLSRNELDILLWIWLNTNPVNGYFSADYKQLEREFHNRISYDNIRKIISSLRKKQYIYFLNHKGRKGSFPIYPIGFYLKSKEIQTLEYLKNKEFITSQSQLNAQPKTKLKNNLKGGNHNFKEQKAGLMKQFSMEGQDSKITTPYNDNNNENNKESNLNKSSNKSLSSFTSKEIPVEGFLPQTYEQEYCWKIAKELGETDLRFILSRLKPENGGFNTIERAWGAFQEITDREKIKNPRKYFNKLIRSLTGKSLNR